MIEGKLSQANGRLRASKVGVLVEIKNDRLCLRATFPPKPGSKQSQPHQQRIYLGLHTNPTGLTIAEKEARKVGALLDCGDFDWKPYLTTIETLTLSNVGEWMRKFEIDYFQRGGTVTTWKGDYWKILKRLPTDEPLTGAAMHQVVIETSPNTKTRRRACMAIGALAKFANLDYDPSPYTGNYSPKRVSPRDLPDDTQIVECFSKLKNPAWKWVYGMMATFGLRNHEVFKLDLGQFKQGSMVVSVLETTKTGSRRVWACYPEWVEQFGLYDVQLPGINLDRPNEKIGNSVTDYFRDTARLPFVPYNLRHCWAVRTILFGLPVELAAQQMGHSVQVHCETYHYWIKDDIHQRAYETLMLRSDRPLPPSIIQ